METITLVALAIVVVVVAIVGQLLYNDHREYKRRAQNGGRRI